MKIKKQKSQNRYVIKLKLKPGDFENCLKATQLENKIKQARKNKVNVDSFKENEKEFIKNNKLILKSQSRFRNEKRNAFTQKLNKISLTTNNDKTIQ